MENVGTFGTEWIALDQRVKMRSAENQIRDQQIEC